MVLKKVRNSSRSASTTLFPGRMNHFTVAGYSRSRRYLRARRPTMKLQRAILGRVVGIVCGISVAACGGGGGGDGSSMHPVQQTTTGLTDTALVSDGVIAATHMDPHLQNAWGVASAPDGPFWISDNNSNESTIY